MEYYLGMITGFMLAACLIVMILAGVSKRDSQEDDEDE